MSDWNPRCREGAEVTAEVMPYGDFWFHDGLWTEEAYLALPHGGPKIELADGRLIVNPSARKAHQALMGRLANLMEAMAPEDLDVEVELNVRYLEVARAVCGESLRLPDPFGSIDPADLLKRRP